MEGSQHFQRTYSYEAENNKQPAQQGLMRLTDSQASLKKEGSLEGSQHKQEAFNSNGSGAMKTRSVISQQGSLHKIDSQDSLKKEGSQERSRQLEKSVSYEVEYSSKQPTQQGSLRKLDSQASLKKEGSMGGSQHFQRTYSYEVEYSKQPTQQTQQGSLGKLDSQNSLKKEGTTEMTMSLEIQKRVSFGIGPNNVAITPFQTEQEDHKQFEDSPIIRNYEGRGAVSQQINNSERKPPISKKSSQGSQLSLNRGSSIEEFRPHKDSSVRDPTIVDTELSSHRDDIHEFSSIQRAVNLVQGSVGKEGSSQGSYASGSSNGDSQLKKKNSAGNSLAALATNNLKGPFQTEPDQPEEPVNVASIRNQDETRISQEQKSALLEEALNKTLNRIATSPLKKSFSLKDTMAPKEYQPRYSSQQAESAVTQEISPKGLNDNRMEQHSLIKIKHTSSYQASQKELSEQSSDESRERTPARTNSWTNLRRDSNQSKPAETEPMKEIKILAKSSVPVSITEVDPAVTPPVIIENKPQEIEDILDMKRYVSDQENDKSKPKVNPWAKNTTPQTDAVNESANLEKSVSYEFSFEETSFDRGTNEKSTAELSKMGRDLLRDTQASDQLLTKQISSGYSKPTVVETSLNRYKVATKPPVTSNNVFYADESQQNNLPSSTLEYRDRNSAFDMKIDTDRETKKEVRHLKPREQMFGENQPNQSGVEFNLSKTSFSVEPMSAITNKVEYRENCKVDYFEVKVIYKDDIRNQMLQNFMNGKTIPTTQVTQTNLGVRRDLFHYNR